MRHIAFVAMLTVTTGPQVCLADGLDVNSARSALATCVQTSVKQLLAKPGLTPIGLAAFVGLNCASARDAYQQSLEHAGVAEVPKLSIRRPSPHHYAGKEFVRCRIPYG